MKPYSPNPNIASSMHQRIVWTEGMFLRPHHFQQMERYLENFVQSRVLPMQGFHWGWSRLVLDCDALALGKLALSSGAGVMPDGTPFAFEADNAPAMLDVPAHLKDQNIVLALPLWRANRPDFSWSDETPAQDGASNTGWTRHDIGEFEIEDANSDAFGPAVLQFGRLNLRLMPASALNADWQSVGVARVNERRNDGQVLLDENYIPPMLAATAHPLLEKFVSQLHGLLQQRGDALAERLSQPGSSGVAEFADFLLLEVINRYTAVTWHAGQSSRLHPELLYKDMLKLACDLATYTSDKRRPTVYPPYLHDDLQATFTPLMLELRRALSIVLEQNAIAVPLQERGNGIRVAQIPSLELIQTAGFVLAVNADMPTDLLRTRFPAQLKMGAVERIRDLVLLQLPGIGLRLLPVAPRHLPYHAGFTYFELDKTGEFWKQLEKSGGLALHVAGDFPGLSMEFWAIRQ
jgi:type VI secretion system protein ImpJ